MVMMVMFEEWLHDMERSWSVERRMIMRDDWDKKRGKFDGSVHYPLIRIMST
jgi:hypothetical protein